MKHKQTGLITFVAGPATIHLIRILLEPITADDTWTCHTIYNYIAIYARRTLTPRDDAAALAILYCILFDKRDMHSQRRREARRKQRSARRGLVCTRRYMLCCGCCCCCAWTKTLSKLHIRHGSRCGTPTDIPAARDRHKPLVHYTNEHQHAHRFSTYAHFCTYIIRKLCWRQQQQLCLSLSRGFWAQRENRTYA